MKNIFTKRPAKELTKKDKARSIIVGSIVAFIIAITPYLFYMYESFPDTQKFETIFGTFQTNAIPTVRTYMWLILSKFVPLLPLILWFLTCKHWWYHAILIPAAMYLFQLITAMNQDALFADESEIYWIIPIMAIIIPIVYLIRVKLFDKVIYGIDLKQIEKEIESYKNKEKERVNFFSKEEMEGGDSKNS